VRFISVVGAPGVPDNEKNISEGSGKMRLDGATARHSSRDKEKGKYKRTHSRFGLIAVLLPWQQLVTSPHPAYPDTEVSQCA
jgi:hypothetical protein